MLLEQESSRQNLRGRNAPPFDLARGWLLVLGGDQLGRPLLAVIVLYMLDRSVGNIILVLAITGIPACLRTTRAEVLQVRDLSVTFHTARGPVQAVKNVSWSINKGEVLAILGESGSGNPSRRRPSWI